MNPFPPVIRIFEILFHLFTVDAAGGTLGPRRDAPSWDIRVVSNLCENVGVGISA